MTLKERLRRLRVNAEYRTNTVAGFYRPTELTRPSMEYRTSAGIGDRGKQFSMATPRLGFYVLWHVWPRRKRFQWSTLLMNHAQFEEAMEHDYRR